MISFGRFGIALFVVLSVSLAVTSFPQYWSRMCESIEEVTDNSTCKDGVWRNPCGKLYCLNGVAGDCDRDTSTFRYGKCAHGLICGCDEKCQGCLRGACYNVLACHMGNSYTKRMKNVFPVEFPNYYNEY